MISSNPFDTNNFQTCISPKDGTLLGATTP